MSDPPNTAPKKKLKNINTATQLEGVKSVLLSNGWITDAEIEALKLPWNRERESVKFAESHLIQTR